MKLPASYIFIASDDEYVSDRAAQEIFKAQQATLGEAVETETIDGRAQNVAEVEQCCTQFMQAAQNMSLFGEQRIIWFRQINFLGDNQTGRAEGTKSMLTSLQELLESFNDPNTYLILSAAPLDKRKAFAKFLDKSGHLQLINASGSAEDLMPMILNECKKAEIRIGEEAATALISKLNGNHRMIMNELEKVITYLISEDEKQITYETVTELVSEFGETDFFELTDAFYSGNQERTLQAIQRHFFTHKDARAVLSSLQNRNRLLIHLRTLHDSHYLDLKSYPFDKGGFERAKADFSEIFEDTGKKSEYHPFGQNPWYLGRLGQTAQRFSLKKLIDIQLGFIEVFKRLIDHPNDHEQIIRDFAIDTYQK